MHIEIDFLLTLVIAILILIIGALFNRHVAFLRNNNIPIPVVGGIVFAFITAALYGGTETQLSFDMRLQGPMMLAFFATIGLTANFKRLREGGPGLLIFLLVVSGFLLVQNAVGALAAIGLDLHPLVGMLGSSITLSGGHGTGAAYAEQFRQIQNIQGAMELAMACATFGLVIGGLIGGPVSQRLISKHRLQTQRADEMVTTTGEDQKSEPVTAWKLLETLLLVILCLLGSEYLTTSFSDTTLTLPAFIWALMTGVLLRNLCEITGLYEINEQTLDTLSTLALFLFLAMAFMSLRLWELLDLAGPLLVILGAQTIAMILYALFVTFRVMGSNYDAAIMAGGHCGFAMGATPTAVANMEAITSRYGPSPKAFLIIPMVGAFFIDLTNTLVIQGFLALPLFGF
jgi:ESS family glutamate:Na+ symporter